MSKMDAVVKLVLFFFVTLLSFSVGTYVGKQVSDAEHRKANLESDGSERNPASIEEHGDGHAKPAHDEHAAAGEKKDAHGEEQQGETLSQKELDQLAEEFSHQSEGEQRSIASEKPAHPEAAAPAHAKEPAHAEPKAEKKDAHGYKTFERGGKNPASTAAPVPVKQPAAPAKEVKKEMPAPTPVAEKEPAARKPSSLPSIAESTAGKYTLQVGSFPSEKDAQEKAKELKAKGWNAFYIAADVNGQKRFRLNVGLFTSLKSAQEFKKEFSKETKSNDVLIQKIVQ